MDKKFISQLGKQLNKEEIKLPDALSQENIENLINKNGSIIDPKRRKESRGGKVIKIISSVAAAIILLIGITAVADITANKIDVSKQDAIIKEQTVESDYSAIETVVLNYYKNIYNEMSKDGVFNSFADDFGVIAESDAEASMDFAGALQDSQNEELHLEFSGDFSHSTTNVQVEGVDEADIIKNDGKYIYYLKNDSIVIADCRDPKNMKKASEISIYDKKANQSATEMFLYNDKLIVVVNQAKEVKTSDTDVGIMHDCLCYMLEYDTIIRVYDISDKTAPELCYNQYISGCYVSSRIVNGNLILVANYTIPYSEINAKSFEESCETVKEYSVPVYSVNNGEMQKIPSDRLTVLDEEQPTEYIITAVIGLDDLTSQPKMNGYLGGAGEIYCTKTEMFVAEYEYSYWMQDGRVDVKDDLGDTHSVVTHIYKFDVTDEGVLYKTDARVGGRCINQFSMDKYGDCFRIATVDSASMVYILDADMNIVGFLGDIASGEDMKAARFMGNTLYLVTFYRTDPLFVIDLTDNTAPVVKGELKIPGFSSYLHPVGNNLVIGIGEGGSVNGTDGSAKVSLFDVSDPCNPKELDSYTVPDAYFNTNHKAFTVVDNNTFALCLTKYGYDTNGEYREDFNIAVFDIEDNKISCNGEYDTCEKDETDEYYWEFRCAFIKSSLLAVNGYGIRAYDMDTKELFGELKF